MSLVETIYLKLRGKPTVSPSLCPACDGPLVGLIVDGIFGYAPKDMFCAKIAARATTYPGPSDVVFGWSVVRCDWADEYL